MIPKPLKTGLLSLLCATTLFATTANAQDTERSRQVGTAAQGSDMWTQAMSGLGLFTPHRDDCNVTTEVFVKVYAENTVDFGFCIDKDEHSAGSLQWEDARHTCIGEGKRLPEASEWKYACDSIAGLNSLTDNNEWITNFPILMERPTNNKRGPAVHAGGGGGCNKSTFSHIMRDDGLGVSSTNFRCVR